MSININGKGVQAASFTFAELNRALSKVQCDDKTTVDQVFTLDEKNPLNTLESGKKSLKDRNIITEKRKGILVLSPMARFKTDFVKVVADALQPSVRQNATMQRYLEKLRGDLLGTGEVNKQMDLKLEVGTMKTLIQRVWDEADRIMLEDCRKQNPELFRSFDNALNELAQLAKMTTEESPKRVAEELLKKVPTFIKFHQDQAQHDPAKLKALLEGPSGLSVFQSTVEDQCKAMSGDVFSQAVHKALEDLEAKKTSVLKQFDEAWAKLPADVARELKPDDGKAARAKLLEAFDGHASSLKGLEQPTSVDALKAMLETLDRQVAEADADLDDRLSQILDESVSTAKTRATNRQKLLEDCSSILNKLTKAAFDDLAVRWRDAYGADGADKLVAGQKKLSTLLKMEVEKLKKAAADGTLAQKDAFAKMAEDFEARLKKMADGPFTRYATTYTELVDGRKKEALARLAQNAIESCRTSVKQALDETKGAGEKKALKAILEKLEDEKAGYTFAKPGDGESVDQVKGRYTALVANLNELYEKTALDPLKAKQEAFDTGLDDLVAHVKDEAGTAVKELKDAFLGNHTEPVAEQYVQMIEKQFGKMLDRLTEDVRHAVRREDGPSLTLENAPAKFQEAVDALKLQAQTMFDRAERQIADQSQAKEAFDTALAGFKDVLARLHADLGNAPAPNGNDERVRDLNGHVMTKAELYLQGRLFAFAELGASLEGDADGAGPLTAESLRDTAEALRSFTQEVTTAVDNAGRNYPKLARLLRKIPLPTTMLKSFARTLADEAAVRDAGARPELADGAPVLVKNGLDRLDQLIGDAARKLQDGGVTDEASKDAFRKMADEVRNEVVRTVNDALAKGGNLENGIGKIVREAWTQVSAFLDVLENEARQKTLSAKTQDVLAALKGAKDRMPPALTAVKTKKKEKAAQEKYKTARIRTLIRAEVAVERYARLVAENLDAIRRAGGVPDPRQFADALRKLDAVRYWLTGYATRGNPTESDAQLGGLLALERAITKVDGDRSVATVEADGFQDVIETTRYELTQPLTAAASADPFEGISAEGLESLDALHAEMDTAQANARRTELEAVQRQIDDLFADVRSDAEKLGQERVDVARRNADEAIERAGAKIDGNDRPQADFTEMKVGTEKPAQKPEGPGFAEQRLKARQAEASRRNEQIQFDQANQDVYAAYEEGIRNRLRTLFLNVPGMDSYLVRDTNGNVAGWTQDGERIIGMAAKDLLTVQKNAAFNTWYGDGTDVRGKERKVVLDADSLTAAHLEKTVLNALREFESGFPVSGLRRSKDASPLPRGTGIFGLDVERLSDDQLKGLYNLVRFSPSRFRSVDPKTDELVPDKLRDRLTLTRGTDRVWAAAIEKALHDGSLKLEEVTVGRAKALGVFLAGACGYKTKAPLAVGTIFGIFRDADVKLNNKLTVQALENARALVDWLVELNGNATTGLDDVCCRVLDMTFATALENTIREGNAWSKEYQILGKVRQRVMKQQRKVNRNDCPDDTWRNQFDPLARVTPQERRVIAMLRAEYAFASAKRGQDNPVDVPDDEGKALKADGEDLKTLRRMLADLKKKPDAKATGKLGGVDVTLRTDRDGNLTASVNVLESETDHYTDDTLEKITYNGVSSDPLVVEVPVKLDAMMASLEDVMLANVPLFGRDSFAALFKAETAKAGAESSSRVRQMCVTFFKSFANVDAAKLCFVSTPDLVALVNRLLGPEGDSYDAIKSLEGRRDAVERNLLSNTVFDETLNSCATLEVYRRYEDALQANPKDVNEKVTVPEPELVRKNETLTESRNRRLREFVADLIQPNDTTKFDLERKGGVSAANIMRHTLLKHATEVRELLAMGGDDIIAFFAIAGGKGQKLDAFALAVRDLVLGLRAVADEHGGVDGLFALLAADDNPATAPVLEKASNALAESSGSVLANLQRAFQDLFVESFGKNSKYFKSPAWTKTLDELVGTVSLDPNKGYGCFLKEVLGSYFGKMKPTDRQRMAALTMRCAHPGASLGEVLGGLLKGAGPILQKLMQGLPQSALPPELQVAVADLKCNLAPIAPEAVRAHLYDIVQGSNGRIKNITVLKSLGAASVGEAFLCRIVTAEHPEGEECVVKMLRPEVQNRARREYAFFQDVMKANPGYEVMLSQRFARIFDELDLTIEATNVAQGSCYDPESSPYAALRVRSMKLHPAAPASTNVLFLRCAPGVTYDKYIAHLREERLRLQALVEKEVDDEGRLGYSSDDPYAQHEVTVSAERLREDAERRQADLSQFVTRWIEEVAFTGGFFHGDVHSGNIMTDDSGLTVIDYGNASQFTLDQRQKIAKMLAASALRESGEFYEAFRELLSPQGQKELDRIGDSVQKDIAAIMSKSDDMDAGLRFVGILQYLQNADVEMPGALFDLIESMRRLDEALRDLQHEADALSRLGDQMEKGFKHAFTQQYWFDKPLVDAFNAMADDEKLLVVWTPKKMRELAKPISDRIVAACSSRAELEAVLVDVRKLAHRTCGRSVDYQSELQALLALADDPKYLFDETRDDIGYVREIFADALAACIVDLQRDVVFHTEDRNRRTDSNVNKKFWPDNLFAQAVKPACVRFMPVIKKILGKASMFRIAGGIFAKKVKGAVGYVAAADVHLDALKTTDSIFADTESDSMLRGALAGLTEDEHLLLRSVARDFCLPPDFGTLIEKNWAEKPKTVERMLDVFMLTINKLDQMIEARRQAGDPVDSKSKPEDVCKGCMPALALFYLAQTGCRHFGGMSKNDGNGFDEKSMTKESYKKLLRAAQEKDKSGRLVDFLQFVWMCATGAAFKYK